MANEITWKYKAGVGAIGGLALAMLKLIEARFFLGALSSTEAIAAYLTYFCYIFLGMVVAGIFAESDGPPDKIKKSSFILGLLAPSVLLAIVSQPIKIETVLEGGVKSIPKLGSWFTDSAYAQEKPAVKTEERKPGGQPKSAPEIWEKAPRATETGQAIVLKWADVEPSFKHALFTALGRPSEEGPYLYVVGTTADQTKALKAASLINVILRKSNVEALVVRPEGSPNLYVTLSTPDSAAKTVEVRSFAKSAAIEALQRDSKVETREAASLLLEGKVVKARSLFEAPGM